MIEWYKEYKGLLFRLAYQLTGSIADAEDAVQEVFVKLHRVDADRITEPKAYLCKMVTNHCMDQLKSAQKRREQYVGPWLPEPLPLFAQDDYDGVIQQDLLSYAMLVLLERLSPTERIVFVLREALCFDYPIIAELTNKTEANCRKLMSRAKSKMGVSEEDLHNREWQDEAWIQQFILSLTKGQVDTVVSLLAEDVVILSDGGGKVSAALRPIRTRDFVSRFLFGIIRKYHLAGASLEVTTHNGECCIVFRENDRITSVYFLHVRNEKIQQIYIMRNPDKLVHLM